MRSLVYSILLGIFAASVCFSQAGPLRTGFAVVTPITGGRLAFSVTETFTEHFEGNLLQSSVQPSPLVTLGIAILDPFDMPATVTLTLFNQKGVLIGARTVMVEARHQRSRFITELFAGVPELTEAFTGQLFINSNVPVAILALAFTGPFFTALPSTQLSGNNTLPVGSPNDLGGITSNFAGIADALLLPQIASGGGWLSTITVANTSILPQSVRVDVFDSASGSLGPPIRTSIPNTILQPGGVVTLSTAR